MTREDKIKEIEDKIENCKDRLDDIHSYTQYGVPREDALDSCISDLDTVEFIIDKTMDAL